MKNSLFAVAIVAVIALLSACASDPASDASSGIADGVKSMKTTLAELQKQVDANDAAGVKESAESLEEAWEKFEDGVKEKSAELYEKVETPLHTIEAGAKADAIDTNVLSQAIKELDNALSEVEK